MAAFSEITIEQGATFNSTVDVEDIYGSPVNLTGYTTSSMMRKSYYSTSAIVITANVSNALQGEISLSISASNTANITPGRYVYDVIINNGANTVTRVVEGIATVLPSVTR